MGKVSSILFVCLGNICRSPLAEVIMGHLLENLPNNRLFVLDSAGISSHHEGEMADPRTIKVAKNHGLNVSHLSRPLCPEDFDRFDLILTMDGSVHQKVEELKTIWGKTHSRIEPMRKYDNLHTGLDVADPYYGEEEDFVHCYDILSECCGNLIKNLI